jgi:hypothetical protein
MRFSKSKTRRAFKIGPRSDLATAANGHLILSWPDASADFFAVLCFWLRLKYKLRRVGHGVYSPYEMILPDLVSPGFRLNAGWDNFLGYHLLSEDHAGDEFLRHLAGTHE